MHEAATEAPTDAGAPTGAGASVGTKRVKWAPKGALWSRMVEGDKEYDDMVADGLISEM